MHYKKISTADRLPTEARTYFVFIDHPNAELREHPSNINLDKKRFDVVNKEFNSFYEVTHWLEPYESKEDEFVEALRVSTRLLMNTAEFEVVEEYKNEVENNNSLLQSIKNK